ncbi:WD40 repeat-like protein [Saccharata proteae CBS 121410]|uniref:WD40 repeat-like protein n=1 Tax=Saccharata proteae CBS 121410 TaxID=1314787 RepID=A0A9P4I411_9PEZI|nr:WD40 repeat-like protein [Saccharata proteae CBS 121410]
MEAAIRWSPHSTEHTPHFIIVDVAANRLRLCEAESLEKNQLKYKQVAHRDNLPNFTAFDWSKTQERFVAIGSASGEASLLQIDPTRPNSDSTLSFPIKHQRKCNSISFSVGNLLATGLDRVRNDFCMNIYDLNNTPFPASNEPYRKLASSEAITSIKFFTGSPQTLIAGVARQCIRIYDLRDSAPVSATQYATRQVHNLAIDPLDENYLISAGPTGNPSVSIWDRRFASRPGPTTPSGEAPAGPVMEMRNVVDNTHHNSAIWSLRFSGAKRGCFGALSSNGELKVVEMASFDTGQGTQHYARHSHSLRHSWYHRRFGGDEYSRIIASDFMTPRTLSEEPSIAALHSNREIEVLKVPEQSSPIHATAMNEMYRGMRLVAEPSPPDGVVAEDLLKLQARGLGKRASIDAKNGTGLGARFDKLSMENYSHKVTQAIPISSRERHEELLTMSYPNFKLSAADTLTLLSVPKRRAKEGYSLDCKRNKEVVANDPWLVDLWDLVHRLDDLAKEDGMVSNEVDLSYVGIASILENSLGPRYSTYRLMGRPSVSKQDFSYAVKRIVEEKEYPPFQGTLGKFPEHRQLCLAICGWTFSAQRIRENCRRLIEQGQYYKAIVLAVFQGHKDIALDLLKTLVRQRLLQNIGLGAVIACDTVNEEQRDMCAWMSDETDDPYLKALLQYFISGDWSTVTAMQQLCLADRVGVALKYLDDARLGEFIKLSLTEARIYGNIEGIVLTGLGERAMDLFEQYIAKFGDLQTAVLAMARTNPLYISDPRWDYWKETYFMQMQVWRCFIERTRFIATHNKAATRRDGVCLNKPPPRQITIRCNHCQLSLARRGDSLVPLHSNSGTTVPPPKPTPHPPGKPLPKANLKSPSQAAGLVCPNCDRRMPRCGICMMFLGSPDTGTLAGAESVKDEDIEAKQMVFCMTCMHGFHGHHAREWFAKHKMCPVPDCQCMCGLLR